MAIADCKCGRKYNVDPSGEEGVVAAPMTKERAVEELKAIALLRLGNPGWMQGPYMAALTVHALLLENGYLELAEEWGKVWEVEDDVQEEKGEKKEKGEKEEKEGLRKSLAGKVGRRAIFPEFAIPEWGHHQWDHHR